MLFKSKHFLDLLEKCLINLSGSFHQPGTLSELLDGRSQVAIGIQTSIKEVLNVLCRSLIHAILERAEHDFEKPLLCACFRVESIESFNIDFCEDKVLSDDYDQSYSQRVDIRLCKTVLSS